MKVIVKSNFLLFLIIVLAFFLRLVLLDRIPTGISNDELHFVLNAKSVFLKFSSLSGSNWNPLSFQTIPGEVSSELPFLILAPFIGPLPTNLFTARLPNAMFGVLSILLIYIITQKITKNKTLALFTALIATLNPWSIYVNRTSFDAPIAIFFFLLTIFLQSSKNPKLILLSFFSSAVAFYSYIGTKIIFFPFVLVSSYFFWKYYHHQKHTLTFIAVVFLSGLITLSFITSLNKSTVGERSSELLSPNSPKIIAQVESERNQSLRYPFKAILDNRYTVYFRTFINKYLYNFSTDILFLNGDHTFMISLWKMGYFYYVDIVLIVFGIIFLFNKYRHFFYLLSTLILLSPIPEAIRSDTIPAYAFHSAFQYPFMFIVIGSGMYYLWYLIHNKVVKTVLILIYLTLFINFVCLYFLKYPIYQSEGFFISRRIVSNYLKFEKLSSKHIYVITPEPDSLFRNYLFYSNIVNKNNIYLVSDQYKKNEQRQTLNWENITFTSSYPQSTEKNFTYIVDVNADKKQINSSNTRTINNLFDGGTQYKIYNGTICQNIDNKTKLNELELTDLNFQKLNQEIFCEKFILTP